MSSLMLRAPIICSHTAFWEILLAELVPKYIFSIPHVSQRQLCTYFPEPRPVGDSQIVDQVWKTTLLHIEHQLDHLQLGLGVSPFVFLDLVFSCQCINPLYILFWNDYQWRNPGSRSLYIFNYALGF